MKVRDLPPVVRYPLAVLMLPVYVATLIILGIASGPVIILYLCCALVMEVAGDNGIEWMLEKKLPLDYFHRMF